ncbi:MAG: class I SAM-dependent methyltransferase [Candidatus Caldarchaeum sp.]|nr:class I SAM-dependent methyltransferase [Candidatus Caldarchaeum sp.]
MICKWVYGYSVPMDVVRSLNLLAGKTLYVVGSGFGETSIMACRETEARVKGFEIHPTLVKLGNKRVEKKGLQEKVSIHDVAQFFQSDCLDCDAVLLESVLNFMENPGQVVSKTAECLSRGGRVGVVELVWTTSPTDELVERFKTMLETHTVPKTGGEWKQLFVEKRFSVVVEKYRKLGLFRKFVQDVSEAPAATFINLFKTFKSVLSSEESREALREFRLFYRYFGDRLVAGCYVLERS